MEAEQLCEKLLAAASEAERDELLAQSTPIAECLGYMLHTSRQKMTVNAAEALGWARLAVLLAERRQEKISAANAHRLIGQAMRVQGDHAGASAALETAAGCAREAGDARLAAQVQIGRIDSLGWLGRYDDALTLARRLEAELREHGEALDAAKVAVNMGALHYRRDQYALALACYARALDTLTQSGEAPSLATVQTNMAAVLMELHRVEEAITLFEQARATFVAHALLTPAAKVDANIGFLHYLSGRHAQAVTALQRARDEFATRGQTLDAAKCDADMAEAYRELNLHPEALDAYTWAIGELESLHVDYDRARAELGRANVWMAAGQFEEALAGLERAAGLFRAHRNTTQLARVRILRAYLLRQEGRVEEARQEARLAAATLTRRGLRGWAAEARFLLAEMEGEAGQDVSRSLHSVRRAARASARGWLECRAERALARHHLDKGNRLRGLRHLRASVQALEQARTLIAPEEMHVSFLRDKMPIYEEMVGALLTRGRRQDIAEALEYVERAKSRLLLERVQSAMRGRVQYSGFSIQGNAEEGKEEDGRRRTEENAIDNPEHRASTGSPEGLNTEHRTPEHQTSDFTERLQQLRAELSRSYHRLNAMDDDEARRMGTLGTDDARALTALEHEYSAVLRQAEGQSGQRFPGLTALPTVIPTAALCRALRPDETLVEYYVMAGSVCAWVITAEQVHFRRDLVCVEEVRFAARRLRYQLQRASGGNALSQRHALRFQMEARSVLAQMYDELLRPLDDLLTTPKLVIVPHGILHGLPFHAFNNGAQDALDRWEILYAPSAAVWYAGAERGRNGLSAETFRSESLIIGMPSPGIEQVAHEVEQLAALLPHAQVFCGAAATLAALQTCKGDCRLVHLATHALFRNDNPLFSGLQFADGWLLARDLYGMRLNCDLATLSACQTGVAFVEAGDELFGLMRGFLVAGARSVLASLWPADDRATAMLMKMFYTRLLAGESKAAALRAAQQSLRTHFPHPYHWAAFALIGERGETTPNPFSS